MTTLLWMAIAHVQKSFCLKMDRTRATLQASLLAKDCRSVADPSEVHRSGAEGFALSHAYSVNGRHSVASFWFGVLGGFIAWVATEIFVRPLIRFYDLRTETAKALALYEDRFNPDPDASPPNPDWLEERRSVYQYCGAGLVAFATSNSFLFSSSAASATEKFPVLCALSRIAHAGLG